MSKKKDKIISLWRLRKPPYLEKTDKRYKKFQKQIKTDGFCDAETWSLFTTIAKFTLPRLIRFREVNACFPGMMTYDDWNKILEELIWTFTFIADEPVDAEESDYIRADKGLELFAMWFRDLWW